MEPTINSDFFYRVAGREGVRFDPPIEVTPYPWFQQMKRSLGNFSLGLTEVTHTYTQYWCRLARQTSPEFLLLEEQV